MRIFNLSLLVILCSLSVSISSAQKFTIEESQPLEEEPVDGWLKLIQLSNGKTALLHITEKDGMRLRVYDKSRRLVVDKTVEPQFETKGKLKIKNTSIEAIFAAKTDLVVFVNTLHKRTPILYRVIIDTEAGKLKKEQEVARLDKYNAFSGYAMVYGKVPPARFYVRKDEHSDNYAVALFNSFESDRNKRIKLIHYNSDHELINEAYYLSPNDEYKYLELIDLIVLGKKKVIACANAYNTNKLDEGIVLFASLEKDKTHVEVKRLQFTENQYFSAGMIRYNTHEDLLVMLGMQFEGKDSGFLSTKTTRYYTPKLIFFDPNDYSTVFYKSLKTPDVNIDYKTYGDTDKEFNGLPQIFYINNDGTYTIVYEEIRNISRSRGATTALLGSMVVSTLDQKAQVINNYLIPKNHNLVGYHPPLYLATRDATAQLLYVTNHYKSFSYVNGTTGKYIFFNDVIENLDRVDNGKLTLISGISGTDGFVCDIDEGAMDRSLLYGKTEKDKYHNFSMFTVSDYNKSNGYYATLKLELKRKKNLKVTWIKLD